MCCLKQTNFEHLVFLFKVNLEGKKKKTQYVFTTEKLVKIRGSFL